MSCAPLVLTLLAAGGANVFAYHVDDPERYGVAAFDPATGRIVVDDPREDQDSD